MNSPLLANIFLHHVFDLWMTGAFPGCPFERYADDIVIHCSSREEALAVKTQVAERLRRCQLEAHPDKTRIVYCRDSSRRQDHVPGSSAWGVPIQCDFLGYSFRPREAKNRWGQLFTSFLPAMSPKAAQAIRTEIRTWGLQRASPADLADLSRKYNPCIRGWVNYYGRYYPTVLQSICRKLNERLVRWAQRKYKRFRTHPGRAWHWLQRTQRGQPELFAHWQFGVQACRRQVPARTTG